MAQFASFICIQMSGNLGKRCRGEIVGSKTTVVGACVVHDEVIEWDLAGPSQVVSVGETFSAQLTAKIADGWHITSISQPPGGPMATSISIPRGQPFRLADSVIGPPPTIVWDETLEMNTEYYVGAANFTIPVEIEANTTSGPYELVVEISFQGCSESTCSPPAKVKVCVPVTAANQV